LLGAIIGDIVGSPYEFGSDKTKDFALFSPECRPTDDSIMTIAVGCACVEADCDNEEEFKRTLTERMREIGRQYPDAGYGGRFGTWLWLKKTEPYNSFGNGAPMRVAPVAWLYQDMDTVRRMAKISAEVTHNHPEGIKGAEAVAAAIYLGRTGNTKAQIIAYIQENFGYDLSRSCDEIRPDYYHVESCQETVPEAITAFLEGESFEDVIRTAVSLGGDCDTLTCIAGAMAEGFYGVAEELRKQCRQRLPETLLRVLERFHTRVWETQD
jgi:ADP-ribosylglycohydrolase